MWVGGLAGGGLATLLLFLVVFAAYLLLLAFGVVRREQVPPYLPVVLVTFLGVWLALSAVLAGRQWRSEAGARADARRHPNRAAEDLAADQVLIEDHEIVGARAVDFVEHPGDGGWFVRTTGGAILFVPRTETDPKAAPRSQLRIEATPARTLSWVKWTGRPVTSEQTLPPLHDPARLEPLRPLDCPWDRLGPRYCHPPGSS